MTQNNQLTTKAIEGEILESPREVEASSLGKLQAAARLLDYTLHFNFKSAGVEKDCRISDLPPETLAILLDYGTRKLNDKVNSLYAMDSNELPRSALVERVWAEALEGRLGERRAQSSGHVGLRNYILAYLRQHGATAKKLEPFKGATPQAIINAIYAGKDAAGREKILAEFTRRYEESLKAIELAEIEF